jgi:hypothetical protein
VGLPPCPDRIPFGGCFRIALPPCEFFPSFVTFLSTVIIFTVVDSQVVPSVFFVVLRSTSAVLPLSTSFFRRTTHLWVLPVAFVLHFFYSEDWTDFLVDFYILGCMNPSVSLCWVADLVWIMIFPRNASCLYIFSFNLVVLAVLVFAVLMRCSYAFFPSQTPSPLRLHYWIC